MAKTTPAKTYDPQTVAALNADREANVKAGRSAYSGPAKNYDTYSEAYPMARTQTVDPKIAQAAAAQTAYKTGQALEGTTGGTTPTGTMTAQITTPKSLKTLVPAPAVITSDAAEKDFANKKAQVDQLQLDTDAHRAAINTPAPIQEPQNQPQQTQPQGPLSLDDQISEMLNSLNSANENIDTDAAAQANPIQAEIQRTQDIYDRDAAIALKRLNKIASGTYPLSAAEKDLLQSTKDSYLAVIEAQKTANSGFEGQMTEALASLGINVSAPTQALGLMHAAISSGNTKIAELNSKMSGALAELQIGFQESDYKMVSDAWEKTASFTKDRLDTLKGMQKSIMDAATQQKEDAREYTSLSLQYIVKSAEFSYEQKRDLIEDAYREQQINETLRHNLQSEAISWHNATKDENSGFKLGQAQVSKLLAGGLTAADIKGIQNDIQEHGIDSVMEDKDLSDAQQKLIKEVYAGDSGEEESKLTRGNVSVMFDLPDDGSPTGLLGTGETTSEKLNEVMEFIRRYKAVGYSDADILKIIKESQDEE